MKWNKFVRAMQAAGATLLHEQDTYIGGITPLMYVYAELNGQLIGTYNPETEEGKILTKPSTAWSRNSRKFTTIKIA